jgi:acylphosphatase
MKRKIIISGSKVHEVGYRVFLLNRALFSGLDGFSASNESLPDGIEQVVIFIEGDEEAIRQFCEIVNNEIPCHAEVSRVSIESYERRVIKILDYMHFIQVEQLDKGIPAILSIKQSTEQMLVKQDQMLEKQDKMLEKQESTIDEIRALRSDLKTEIVTQSNHIKSEIVAVKGV